MKPTLKDHALDLAFTATVIAGGKAAAMKYSASMRSLSGVFSPALDDGTSITVTFGPEVPLLSGRTITLPAATTRLATPERKPAGPLRELRGYTPGTDFSITWSQIAGKKWIEASSTNHDLLNSGRVVDCFPTDDATSFTVPASVMGPIAQVPDPSTQFPRVSVISRSEQTDRIDTIQVRKTSSSALFFQLNLAQ